VGTALAEEASDDTGEQMVKDMDGEVEDNTHDVQDIHDALVEEELRERGTHKKQQDELAAVEVGDEHKMVHMMVDDRQHILANMVHNTIDTAEVEET